MKLAVAFDHESKGGRTWIAPGRSVDVDDEGT
jgi:hypothetical protein